MSYKKYFITGGSGFIGSALVRRLVTEGHKVRVLDNESRGSKDRLRSIWKEIEFIQGDIRDANVVAKACRNMDSVFHLAYINGTEFFYTKPDAVLDVGVKGIVNVIDACIKQNVAELILASSSEVYQTPPTIPTNEKAPFSIPDPLNPRYSYSAGKIISEVMAINYGRKYFKRVLIFRPHNVYGPNMGREHVIPQFVLRMRELVKTSPGSKLKFPIQGSGKETRAFCFIEDFIDGLMLLKDKGKHLGIYHIGTEEEIAIRQVAEEIGAYFQKKIVLVPGARALGSTLRRCPDISKMKALGYRPKINFKKGVAITAAWYENNANKVPRKERRSS